MNNIVSYGGTDFRTEGTCPYKSIIKIPGMLFQNISDIK